MTRSRCLILLAAVTLLWAGVPDHRADTVNLTPNDNDVRILIGADDTNYHFQDILSVYNGGGGNDQRSFLQFDLSSIPPNQTIASATLRVWRDSAIWGGGDSGLPTNVFRVVKPWVNTEVTANVASAGNPWDNKGGDFVGTTGQQDTDPYTSNTLNLDNGTTGIFPLDLDVTSLVSEWYLGTFDNNGLLIHAPLGDELHFHADRGPDPNLYPCLMVTFSP